MRHSSDKSMVFRYRNIVTGSVMSLLDFNHNNVINFVSRQRDSVYVDVTRISISLNEILFSIRKYR